MLIILNKYVAEAIMMDQTFAGSSNKTDTFTTEAKNGQYLLYIDGSLGALILHYCDCHFFEFLLLVIRKSMG